MPRFLQSCFLLIAGCASHCLSGQVEEFGKAEGMELAGSRIERLGLRVLAIPSKVTTERYQSRKGAFIVIADPQTKTYWWMIRRASARAPSRSLNWAMDFDPLCRVERSPSGFTIFCVAVTQITIGASRGSYTDEAQLSTLVLNDFNRTASEHLTDGFGFVNAQIELRKVLDETFFLRPYASNLALPKLDAATYLSNGGWELTVSSPLGKVAYITLARDFNVLSHRIVQR